MQIVELTKEEKDFKNQIVFIYVMFIGTFLIPFITLFVGVIVAYINKSNMPNTWLNDHIHWLINTFWVIFLWLIISIPSFIYGLIYFQEFIDQYIFTWIFSFLALGLLLFLWYLYRVVRGLIRLSSDKSPY